MEAGEIVRRQPFGDNPSVGERGAVTQRRILEAGLVVFAQHGYHDAGIEQITEATGCSRPAFYQYFSSKEDLFWRLAGLLAREMGELADRLEPVTPDAAGVDHVAAWLGELTDLSVRFTPIITGFQAAIRERAPDRDTLAGIGGGLGSALLASGVASGADHPGLGRPALANVMAGVAMRSIYYWQMGIGAVRRDRFVTAAAQSIHRVLHGPIEGVNVTAVVAAPPRSEPAWPELPSSREVDPPLRPRGQRTREQLLAAAREVLPERGYHETRIDDIVSVAGISHGSFYRYFENKDDLFHVLAEQAAEALVDLVGSFPADLDEVDIEAWFSRWIESYRANGGVISAWQELDHDDPELAAFSIDVAAVVFDRLTRIVHRRDFGDPVVDALLLLSVVERVPYNVLVFEHLDESEAVAASTFVIRRGLFGLAV